MRPVSTADALLFEFKNGSTAGRLLDAARACGVVGVTISNANDGLSLMIDNGVGRGPTPGEMLGDVPGEVNGDVPGETSGVSTGEAQGEEKGDCLKGPGDVRGASVSFWSISAIWFRSWCSNHSTAAASLDGEKATSGLPSATLASSLVTLASSATHTDGEGHGKSMSGD